MFKVKMYVLFSNILKSDLNQFILNTFLLRGLLLNYGKIFDLDHLEPF